MDNALGGTFTWTFAATRASIAVDYIDGSEVICGADAEPSGQLVRLVYDPGTPCGGEVDTIGWQRDGQDLRLTLGITNAGMEDNRAYLEAKVWQPVEGLGGAP